MEHGCRWAEGDERVVAIYSPDGCQVTHGKRLRRCGHDGSRRPGKVVGSTTALEEKLEIHTALSRIALAHVRRIRFISAGSCSDILYSDLRAIFDMTGHPHGLVKWWHCPHGQ